MPEITHIEENIIITEDVPVHELDQHTYLVADDSDTEYVSINGPVEDSSAMPGLCSVETSIGIVYLDPEFNIRAGDLP